MPRFARAQERGELRELWKTIFGDSDPFVDWFFSERFLPERCVVEERDGRIVGAMHGIPAHFLVRGSRLAGSIVSGVATLPEYRGQGVMHAVFSFYMQQAHRRGEALVSCHPARLETYYSLGHYPTANALFARGGSDGAPAEMPIVDFDLRGDLLPLSRCYDRFCRRYSGIVARTPAEFAFKCADYASDGARCLALLSGGEPTAYCIYSAGEDGLYGEECVAAAPEAYPALLRALATLDTAGAEAKLPPDAPLPAGWQAEVRPWTVMGCAGLPTLLRAVAGGLPDFAVQVDDPVLPEHCDVFGPEGALTDRPPVLRLSAGRLVQWVCGYRSLADLLESGDAQALDAAAAARLDAALPPLPCFAVDEY